MCINNRFRIFRKKYDINQAQLADWLGIGRSTVTGYEKEGTKIPEYVKIILGYKYRLNIDWLETGNGEMLISDIKEQEKIEKLTKVEENIQASPNTTIELLIYQNAELIKQVTTGLTIQQEMVKAQNEMVIIQRINAEAILKLTNNENRLNK
ncbi:MAG: hypothetical protein ACOYN4_00435 [Bacteroidales bacterium]